MTDDPFDTADLRQRVNLLALIGRDTPLRKVAATRGGEYAGPCPFCGGTDRFRVQPALPDGGRWWCRRCGDDHWQDAIAYLQRRDGLSFPEACAALADRPAAWPTTVTRPLKILKIALTPTEVEPEPTPAWRAAAAQVVRRCSAALWTDPAARARAWLAGRGLTEPTLRRWQVGYQPHDAELAGLWVPRGIVLPWRVGGELWQLKVRRPTAPTPTPCPVGARSPRPIPRPAGPKYTSVGGGHPLLFGADTLPGRAVAVLCEGELDAMLLDQEAGDLVGVATLGSCDRLPGPRARALLLPIPRLLVAYDADAPGERGARRLLAVSPRLRRLQLPAGHDLTELQQRGGDLRAWLAPALAPLARTDAP